jgi:hypothetical protein
VWHHLLLGYPEAQFRQAIPLEYDARRGFPAAKWL